MLSMSWEPLPALVGVVVLALAAVAQFFVGRVPNLLTLPAILAGWLFAVYVEITHAVPGHPLLGSLFGAVLALVIMLPAYGSGRLGAGCVKAQMAFAAWIGGAIPLAPALTLVASATVGGLAVSFALLHLAVADIPGEQRPTYEFPAQVTITLVAIITTLVCWMLSYPA